MEKIVDEIFKAYDIRGKVGSELKPEIIEKIGFVFGKWLPTENAVAVGRDMRPDSAELSKAIISGLRKSGRNVVDIGQVTSDMIYFAVGHFNYAGGAMITASHNPGEYNGIKLCREEAKPVGIESGLAEIKAETLEVDKLISNLKGKIESKDVSEDWVDHVLGFIDVNKLKPLKIAVDAGNGMAGKIFPEIEPYLPFEVNEMYFELDGTFPNHIANPLEPKNLVDLQRVVKEKSYDAGIAFDGDGDRAVLVDEKGEPLTGTVMTALLAQYFLKKNPGSVILHNAICGNAAIEAINKAGGIPKRTKVGHSYIKADMRENKAIFAGEHSGHYYFKDNFYADSGLLAAVIALFIISESGQPLSKFVAKYRNAFVQIPETNFEVKNKDQVLKLVKESYKNEQIDELDGLTVKMKNGAWFNLRASNTEPLLRLNAEANNKQELNAIVKKVTSLIN